MNIIIFISKLFFSKINLIKNKIKLLLILYAVGVGVGVGVGVYLNIRFESKIQIIFY